MNNNPLNLTLSARETAAAIRVSPRTLHALVVTGMVPPPIRIGKRRIVWRLSDIEAFLANGGSPGLQKPKKPGRPRKNGGAA